MDTECQLTRQLEIQTPTYHPANQLLAEVSVLDVVKTSLTDPDFEMPPEIHPWSESPSAVLYTYDRLRTGASPSDDELKTRQSRFWQFLFLRSSNQEVLDRQRVLQDSSQATTSFVQRAQAPSNGNAGEAWSLSSNAYTDALDFTLSRGAAVLDIAMRFCHALDPSQTPVVECQTGGLGPGEIYELAATATGEDILLELPKLSGKLSGAVSLAADTELSGKLTFDMTLSPYAKFSRVLFWSTEVFAEMVNHPLHGNYLSALRGHSSAAAHVRVAGTDASLRVAIRALRPWRTRYQIWSLYIGLHVEGWIGTAGYEDEVPLYASFLSAV